LTTLVPVICMAFRIASDMADANMFVRVRF
jgi:hypothetical protein